VTSVSIGRSDGLSSRVADLFSPGAPSRESWLRDVLSKSITFRHRGVEYHFVPSQQSDRPELIVGNIGRQRLSTENDPPEQGLGRIRREIWKGAAIVIDPRHHPEGQKAAVEADLQVGKPVPLMESLCEAINLRTPPEPYLIESSPISDPNNFWEFVDSHPGEVVSVTFEFIAPNMFGIRDSLDEGIKDMAEHEKIERLKLQLKSRDGLVLSKDRIDPAVRNATEGGGSISARDKKGGKYNSRKRVRFVNVGDAINPGQAPLRERIGRAIKVVFGDE
jgi:hypothetical protein